MASLGWKEIQAAEAKLKEAALKLTGINSKFESWERIYSHNYWYEGFASSDFKFKEKDEISHRLAAFAELIRNVRSLAKSVSESGEQKPAKRLLKYTDIWTKIGHTLVADYDEIVKLVSSRDASDPSDAKKPEAADTYKALTKLLDEKEKSLIDDWRTAMNQLVAEIDIFAIKIKDRARAESGDQTTKERHEWREKAKILEKMEFIPEKGKKYTLDELLKKREDIQEQKTKIKEMLKSDDLSWIDDDISRINEAAETPGRLLSKAKFGIIRAPIVCVNSFIRDIDKDKGESMGKRILLPYGIKPSRIAQNYILLRNSYLLGWRNELESKKNFDPVLILRRIKKKGVDPLSRRMKNGKFQIYSSPIRRGDYTYVVLIPTLHDKGVSIGEERDIVIRKWQFADSMK